MPTPEVSNPGSSYSEADGCFIGGNSPGMLTLVIQTAGAAERDHSEGKSSSKEVLFWAGGALWWS